MTPSAFRHGFSEADFYELLTGRSLKIRSEQGLPDLYELLGRNFAGDYWHPVYRMREGGGAREEEIIQWVDTYVDGYHAGFVHESAFSTFAHFGVGRYAQRPPIPREGLTRGFPGGHSTLEGGYEAGRGSARSLPQLYQEYLARLTQRHGEARARDIVSNRHLPIVNLSFLL